MKLNLIIVLFLSLSCKVKKQDFTNQHGHNALSNATLIGEFNFDVSNENPNNIGYRVWETDENEGIKSICVSNGYVYMTDVYHNNIKKVNLETGKIIAGPRIPRIEGHFDDKVWLRDIAVFNDIIYVTSDLGYVFLLDRNLNFFGKIQIGVGQPYFFSKSKEELNVFLKSEQNEDMSVEVSLLRISESGKHKKIKELLSMKDFNKRTKNYYSKGQLIRIGNDNMQIETDYWIVDLPLSIPFIEEYDAFNIDFNKTTLAYFNTTTEKLKLSVYKID